MPSVACRRGRGSFREGCCGRREGRGLSSLLARSGEIWGELGRYGEMRRSRPPASPRRPALRAGSSLRARRTRRLFTARGVKRRCSQLGGEHVGPDADARRADHLRRLELAHPLLHTRSTRGHARSFPRAFPRHALRPCSLSWYASEAERPEEWPSTQWRSSSGRTESGRPALGRKAVKRVCSHVRGCGGEGGVGRGGRRGCPR